MLLASASVRSENDYPSKPIRMVVPWPAGGVTDVATRRVTSDIGSVVVAIEYPSLTALAADDKKAAADPALGAWVRGLDKMRKIVSDSLYSESKP